MNQGLYQEAYEHDACGVGMVVNIHGGKSHELVDNALKVLENMEHRGAETRDKTGDGAGIMVQIPHEFILLQGIPVPEKGRYGTGLVFLPKDEKAQQGAIGITGQCIDGIDKRGGVECPEQEDKHYEDQAHHHMHLFSQRLVVRLSTDVHAEAGGERSQGRVGTRE